MLKSLLTQIAKWILVTCGVGVAQSKPCKLAGMVFPATERDYLAMYTQKTQLKQQTILEGSVPLHQDKKVPFPWVYVPIAFLHAIPGTD